MTYEEALQIAIKHLGRSINYLKVWDPGFPRVEKQIDELMSASDALRQALKQPKREWVGLTYKEFVECVEHLEYLEIAADCWLRIEAKLKEKNHET